MSVWWFLNYPSGSGNFGVYIQFLGAKGNQANSIVKAWVEGTSESKSCVLWTPGWTAGPRQVLYVDKNGTYGLGHGPLLVELKKDIVPRKLIHCDLVTVSALAHAIALPLPELMLTSHQCGSVAFPWEQFHRAPKPLSCVMSLKIVLIKLLPHLSGTGELTRKWQWNDNKRNGFGLSWGIIILIHVGQVTTEITDVSCRIYNFSDPTDTIERGWCRGAYLAPLSVSINIGDLEIVCNNQQLS